ncbi:MAG: bifunctional metallophosphatase/5'-nucleotidase [Spirochaetota bacterium]|nr:bifunctional metallophosphatase/5'-nucleotidase [Spirochaetota bacterium]
MDSTDIFNMTDLDIAVLGNHEFDFGLKQAYNIITNRNFPTITANIYERDTSNNIVPPTFTTNINGKSIGFIGLLTSDEVYADKDKFGQFFVTDEFISLSNLLLTEPSITTNDLLVLVSHTGIEKEQAIAKAFPNLFDLIIGGHSHTYLEQPIKINKTLIVQLNNNIKELGKLDLNINSKNEVISYTYQAIPIKNITPDPKVRSYIKSKQGLVDQQMGFILATISETLEDTDIRRLSTPLGNFITDMVFEGFKDRGVEILMLNSGGIRSSIDEGNITLGKVYEIHPFDNIGVYFETTGSALKQILSHSANNVRGTGGFLQLSKGLSVTVENDKSISSIILNGIAIDENKIYKIITSDWTFNGGDGYNMIKKNAQNIQTLGFDVRDILIQQLKNRREINVNTLDNTKRWNIK